MDFYQAMQAISQDLRNGVISVDQAEVEVKALKYAREQAATARDERQGVAA